MQTGSNHKLISALLILLLAAAVRMVGVGHFSVWTDEGWTVWATERLFDVFEKVGQDRHPPLYFLSLALWQELAGMSRLALRLPSVLSGVLLTALVWQIGDRVGGARVALYASFLVAITPASVYYTQEIRHFGWLMAAVALSMWLFMRVLERPTIPRYGLYAVSVALIMYILYIGFFVILIQVVVALLVWRGSLRQKLGFIGAWALALALFSPWLVVIIRYQLDLMSVGIAGVGNVTEITPSALWELLTDLLGNGLPLLLITWLAAAWALIRQRPPLEKRSARLAAVLLWGVGTFLLMMAINAWFTVFRVRTVTPLIPGFALLTAFGLASLPRRAQVLLIIPLIPLTIYRYLPLQPRGALPELAAALAQDYQPGDLIVVETGWSDDEFIYEIRNAVGWDADVIRTLQWVDGRGPNKLVVLEIEDQLRAAERIWVVHWNQPPQVASWLQGEDTPFREVRFTRHWVGRDLEIYEGGYFARVDGGYRLYLFEAIPPEEFNPPTETGG